MFRGGDDSEMVLDAAVMVDCGVPNAVFHCLRHD